MKVVIVSERCMSCGMCVDSCRNEAIEVTRTGKSYGSSSVNQEKCKQCGACLDVGCPGDAIEVG